MATVTVFTAARMQAIEDGAIVDGSVVGDNLILEKHDGTPIDAGNVRGPQGSQGIAGTAGINASALVRAATTANITQSGTQTIDGISLAVGDRVLCKDQTSQPQNGIWVVASGAWTRATDADTALEIAAMIVSVQSGTVNGGTRWVNTFKSVDTIGSGNMPWYRLHDGSNLAVSNMAIVSFSGVNTDSSGHVTVTHGLPWTPTLVLCMNGTPDSNFPVQWGVDTIGSTTFRVRFLNASVAGAANAIAIGTQRALCVR